MTLEETLCTLIQIIVIAIVLVIAKAMKLMFKLNSLNVSKLWLICPISMIIVAILLFNLVISEIVKMF